MTHSIFAGLLALALSFPVLAQDSHTGHHTAQAEQAQMVEGEVRNINAGLGTVTIRHGDIPNLNMSAMTMVFTARPAKLLDGLKKGDRIRFMAIDDKGELIVTRLEKQP